ncbi:MAG TPA: hypothetical protein VJ729_06780 [Nitrososphaeraceae archaeon]|nr:hypothetical protein [Nitrososphaeraceae archaeon]
MDRDLKILTIHVLLFIGWSLGINFVVTYLFGFILGFIINIIIFIGAVFYIQKKQMNTIGHLQFNGPSIIATKKLNYVCLLCGRRITGKSCSKCGSNMKKALF